MLNWALPAIEAKRLILAAAQAAEARKFEEAVELARQAEFWAGQFVKALEQAQKVSGK